MFTPFRKLDVRGTCYYKYTPVKDKTKIGYLTSVLDL